MPEVTKTSNVSGSEIDHSRKASMLARVGGRTRTAIMAWTGRPIAAATRTELASLRSRAAESLGVYVADMPAAAQLTRVYDEYLANVADTRSAQLEYYAVSLSGPNNRIDKLVKKLPLLS